jgi:hypothetical protein
MRSRYARFLLNNARSEDTSQSETFFRFLPLIDNPGTGPGDAIPSSTLRFFGLWTLPCIGVLAADVGGRTLLVLAFFIASGCPLVWDWGGAMYNVTDCRYQDRRWTYVE